MGDQQGIEQQIADIERQRRDFVRDYHPDVGGDREAFIAGLRQYDQRLGLYRSSPREPPARVTAVHRTTRRARLVRLVRLIRQVISPTRKPPPRVR